MKKLRAAGVWVSAVMLMQFGCAGPSRGPGDQEKLEPKGVMVPPPKEPPAAPPRQEVALDSTLIADARREVVESLNSSDALVRSQALEALRNEPADVAAPHIINALNDPKVGVRFGAAMMAGELGIKQAYPALVKLASDPDRNVQVAARFALHKLGDTRRTHDLEKFAVDSDPRVRRNVALALGMLGERSALKILQVMRTDLDPLVRQQSIEAMWRLGDESALNSLVALTASGFADDKIIGLLGLAAPKRQIVRGNVRGLLAGDDIQVEVALVAARAMGMLGSDDGYQIALDGARSADPQQRFLAALALGAIGRSDAQDELRRLLSDTQPNVQLAAAAAVLELGSGRQASL